MDESVAGTVEHERHAAGLADRFRELDALLFPAARPPAAWAVAAEYEYEGRPAARGTEDIPRCPAACPAPPWPATAGRRLSIAGGTWPVRATPGSAYTGPAHLVLYSAVEVFEEKDAEIARLKAAAAQGPAGG